MVKESYRKRHELLLIRKHIKVLKGWDVSGACASMDDSALMSFARRVWKRFSVPQRASLSAETVPTLLTMELLDIIETGDLCNLYIRTVCEKEKPHLHSLVKSKWLPKPLVSDPLDAFEASSYSSWASIMSCCYARRRR